jgi:hypothetical protein
MSPIVRTELRHTSEAVWVGVAEPLGGAEIGPERRRRVLGWGRDTKS